MITLIITSFLIVLAMLNDFLGSLGALLGIVCPLSVVLTGFLVKPITSAWGKRIVSWIVPLAFCLAAWGLNLNDLFEGLKVGYVIAVGVLVGLVNNGIYSIDEIKSFIKGITNQS